MHVPYIQPGETRTLTPIALEAFQGGWQQGVDIYKRWRRHLDDSRAAVPAWAREPHAWQQIHINSPEDELRIRFRDLPKVGEECARHGVKAIQLVGWNDGGQDQGNPSHDPDPRLGTFEELKEAIAKIQALGVKIDPLRQVHLGRPGHRALPQRPDPAGDQGPLRRLLPCTRGYQYQTATQLLDINTKRLIPMCFLSEEYLRVCDEEFQKTVELGADGILFDECLHHGPALLCFDPRHGHRYGAPVYANDRELIQQLRPHLAGPPTRTSSSPARPATTGRWRPTTSPTTAARTSSTSRSAATCCPMAQFMTAVTGFNDRNMINQCLLYRYIISYEPYNFKGHLDDYPLTMAYGKQMDALRTELREYFWDGEFRDKVGARVTAGDRPHHPYAVFVNRATGRSGVVVANYDERQAVTVRAELESGQRLGRYRLVDDPQWHTVEEEIPIPPCSAAVIIE